MKFRHIEHDISLSPFVKRVMTFESAEKSTKTCLPFFADGFPGLMYQNTPNGLTIHPHEKLMPQLFLYGQTIAPIEIEILGEYELIIFQLHPFTLKILFGIEPKSINDDCFDLTHPDNPQMKSMLESISVATHLADKVKILSGYIHGLISERRLKIDPAIRMAIERILSVDGKLKLGLIAKELNMTKRTFERRFEAETGLLPKQFAKIIQFHRSLTQLSIKDYTLLTDVVYKNGYADQSHFIRVFKSFTGKTPTQFTQEINLD